MAVPRAHPPGSGVRGILGPVASLDRWLQVVFLALLATCAVRYLVRHPFDTGSLLVLIGAGALAGGFAARRLGPRRPWWPPLWVGGCAGLWGTLTLAAPSFAWTAVPLAFAALQVLEFRYAVALVVVMTLVVSAAWARISDWVDPTLVVGPVGMAVVTVLAYRALQRESAGRQRLLDELTEAQADLADAQRRAGALTERTRLSREIHDSVGQGLTSITLLLNAAEQDWDRDSGRARELLRTAGGTARDSLDEVRRVVRDLAPTELESDPSGAALAAALTRVVDSVPPPLDARLRVHGTASPVPPAVGSALVSTARGALANATEHSRAAHVVVSLTYLSDVVLLDVRDDGVGFTPTALPSRGLRGRGLRGIHDRAAALGGRAGVESAPGEGTTISVAFPLPTSPGETG